MKLLSVLLLSVVLLGAPSWSSAQSSPQFPGKRDYSDPNVDIPRVPGAGKRGPVDPNIRNIQRIIIKWKRTAHVAQALPPTAEQLQRLRQTAGVEFTAFKDHGWGVVLQLAQPMSRIEAEEIAARIRALPEIEYAEPERFFHIDAVPNDPLFQSGQWNLQSGPGVSTPRGHGTSSVPAIEQRLLR